MVPFARIRTTHEPFEGWTERRFKTCMSFWTPFIALPEKLSPWIAVPN
jgi:hypothetical protein